MGASNTLETGLGLNAETRREARSLTLVEGIEHGTGQLLTQATREGPRYSLLSLFSFPNTEFVFSRASLAVADATQRMDVSERPEFADDIGGCGYGDGLATKGHEGHNGRKEGDVSGRTFLMQ